MQRRKFLLGAGSAAVGASALVGSGAYGAMTAERTAMVDVVTDDNSLVGLSPGIDSDTVKLSNNPGELIVDTSLDGSTGVNNNSVYLFGEFDEFNPLEDVPLEVIFPGAAFVVWFGTHWSGESENKTDAAISVISIPDSEPVGSSEGDGDPGEVQTEPNPDLLEPPQELPAVSNDEYAFHISNDDTDSHNFELTVPTGALGDNPGVEESEESSPLGTLSFEDVVPGDYVAVTFVVVAGRGTADTSLSGQLDVSATGATETPEPADIPE